MRNARIELGHQRIARRAPRIPWGPYGVATGLLLCAIGCGQSENAAAIAGNSSGAAIASTSPLLLPEVKLGVIPRAGKRELIWRLCNPTKGAIQWAGLRTSCHCLSAVTAKSSLEPSDDVLTRISYDGGERPEFVGNLAIEVTAISSDGTEVFRFDVRAEIVPEDEFAFCDEAKP